MVAEMNRRYSFCSHDLITFVSPGACHERHCVPAPRTPHGGRSRG